MYFKKEKMWLELLQLEKSLCQKFPAQKSCTINLVEAFFLAGEYKEGRIKFEETKAMFPGLLDDDIKRINQMFPNALISEEKFAQRYNISNVVVVEGDQAEMTKVESALQRLGVEQFLAFTTYKEAWEYLKNADEPDLIIMEWTKKTKDLSREQFAQRVRSKGFIQVPLVIMLSHLKPFESNLINDIKAIQIIKKPLREKDLLMSLAYAIQQYRSPDERKPVEYKIEQSIKAGNLSFAYYLRKKLLRNPNVSLPRKYFIESLFYFYNGQYEKCRSLLIKGIKLSVGDKKSGADVKPNLDKTVLLAKCLFQLGDKELAIQMMEKARDRSPFNIDLLIHLVHMNYEFGNSEGVQESLEKAEAIDRDNTQVVNAKAKMALYNGNIKHAHEMMAASENLTDIIGSLNNQAVKSIRNGDFEKGIQLYQSAIKALPIKEFDYLGVVHYNLALAYLRKDLPEAGLNYLRQVLNYPQSRVFQKANSLLSRAEKSVADNRPTSQLLGAKVSANTEEQTDLNIIISELNESSTAYGLSGIHVPDRRSDYSQKLLTTGDVSFSRKNLPSSLNVESGPSSKKAG
ncbi:MAG: tetratricopeptide repeat protein [Oligoflexus sp.]